MASNAAPDMPLDAHPVELDAESQSNAASTALLNDYMTLDGSSRASVQKTTRRLLAVGGFCALAVCLGSICMTIRGGQWGPQSLNSNVADITKVQGKSCSNSAGSAKDKYGHGCEWYDDRPEGCGGYDDDDFKSTTMCCACKDSTPGGSDSSKKCHVMYKMADNNLDAAIAGDVEEVIANTAAVEDPKYFPLIFVDRHKNSAGSGRIQGLMAKDGTSPAAHHTGVRYIKKDFGTKKVKVAKEMGEKDADKEETVTAFLTWAFQECMDWDNGAQVLLHFSSHGTGWGGFGGDEGGRHTSITNAGIKSAIQASMQAVSPKISKLAFLGFDACLMQSYIAMSVYAPITEWYMASEATEPGHGWDFSGLNPNLNVKGFAEAMILKFALEKHGFRKHQKPKTLAVFDSASFSAYKGAMDAVFDKMREGLPSIKPTIVKARGAALDFQGVLWKNEQVDLGDFLEKIHGECSKPGSPCSASLKSAITHAKTKFEAMSSAGMFRAGPGTPARSTGMAMLFPEAKDASTTAYAIEALKHGWRGHANFSNEAWMKFLSKFLLGQGGGDCKNTDNGAKDSYGDGCVEYDSDPSWCKGYDDNDFNSAEMCCICGGGQK